MLSSSGWAEIGVIWHNCGVFDNNKYMLCCPQPAVKFRGKMLINKTHESKQRNWKSYEKSIEGDKRKIEYIFMENCVIRISTCSFDVGTILYWPVRMSIFHNQFWVKDVFRYRKKYKYNRRPLQTMLCATSQLERIAFTFIWLSHMHGRTERTHNLHRHRPTESRE